MNPPNGKRDIVRLRTFADDVERLRGEKGDAVPPAETVVPTEEKPASGGIFFKVKKKNLSLEEQKANTSLDSDGIQFDEATAAQVEDQAYEENKSIADEHAGPKEEVVDLKQADTLEAIQERAAAPKDFSIKPTAAKSQLTKPKAAPNLEPASTETLEGSAAAFLAKASQKQAAATTSEVPAAPIAATKTPPPTPKAQEATAPVAAAPEIAEETIETVSQSTTNALKSSTVRDITEDDLSEGSVVTDKKRERFKLFPAMGKALTDWFVETKETIEEANREKHTVTRTEDRAETIKAAAQAKTLAPSEDFTEVAGRIKETVKKPTDSISLSINPKSDETPRWTYTTGEAGEPDAQATEAPKETVVSPTPTAAPTEAPSAANFVEQTSPTAPEATSTQPQSNTQVPQTPLQAQAAAMQAEQTATAQATTAATAPTGRGVAMPYARPRAERATREYLPSPIFAIAVVVFAIVAGVGTSVYFFWQPEPEAVIPQATTNPLFTAELQSNIDLGSHAQTMNTILNAIQAQPGTLYMYLTRNNGAEILTPGETMSFLAPQVPGSFARSVTNVSFGAYDTRPFIVLRVNNFDNAFSGMLAWEQTMSADLAPLFGAVVTETFDPLARTDNQTRSAFFTDIIVSNLSSRLLANERGEDRILYTFIDKQTVVITTDRLQLTNILPLLR